MFSTTNPKLKISVERKNSRYVVGGKTEVTPGFAQWWEKDFLEQDETDEIYILEKKFEGRPDLLAHAFYDDTYLWWVICQHNTILDFNTDFVEGLVLRIPTKDRVTTKISPNKLGGIPSKAFK